MKAFYSTWDKELSESFNLYSLLDSASKNRLLDLIGVFISEKDWDSDIEESNKLKIASQACFPVLNRKTNLYPSVTTVTTDMDQNYWYKLNSIQFEFELGKMASFKTKGRFEKLSHQYFYEPEVIRSEEPEIYSWLDIYFNKK